MFFSQAGVEASSEGGERDVRCLRGNALQYPLGLSEMWLCCLSGLLQGQGEKELQRSVLFLSGQLGARSETRWADYRNHCMDSYHRKTKNWLAPVQHGLNSTVEINPEVIQRSLLCRLIFYFIFIVHMFWPFLCFMVFGSGTTKGCDPSLPSLNTWPNK